MTLPELFNNFFQTALTDAVGTGDGTIAVAAVAPAALQATGQFRALVTDIDGGNAELMLVTGDANTQTWQVTRGVEGTNPAAHSEGDLVTHIVTAGAIGGQSDAAAGVPSLRTLGPGSSQAAQGSAFAAAQTALTTAESNITANAAAITTEQSRAEAAEGALIPLTQKAANSGVASLDSSGKLPTGQNTAATVQVTGETIGQVPASNGDGTWSPANALNTNSADLALPPHILVLDRPVDLNRSGNISPGSDVTALINSVSAARLSAGYAPDMYFSQDGTYTLNGSQVSGSALGHNYSGQILLPANTNSGPHIPWRLRGTGPPSTIGGNSSTPNGVILQSNATSGKIIDAIPGYSVGNPFTAVCGILEDISFEVPNNPQCGGIDFGAVDKCAIRGNVNIYNQGGAATALTGTASNFGLRMPAGSNAGLCTVENLVVQGFPIGIILGEHGQFNGYVTVANNVIGIRGGGGHIPNVFLNLNTRGNLIQFAALTATQRSTIQGIAHFEAEGLPINEQILFLDPLGALSGHLVAHMTAYTEDGTMLSYGGQNVDVEYIPDSAQATDNQTFSVGYRAGWMNSHPRDNLLRLGEPTLTPAAGGNCTITIASPAVITQTAHGLSVGTPIIFSTTSALPTGLVLGMMYYVSTVVDANNFQVSLTSGGTAVTTTGTQSGTQSFTQAQLLPGSACPTGHPWSNNLGSVEVVQAIGGVCTVSIATPGVVGLTAHGFVPGDPVQFTTTGALPTGLTASTVYYVVGTGGGVNSFTVATAPGGTAINTSGSQSGVHTVTPVSAHGTMTSLVSSGSTRLFLPALLGGVSRIITVPFTTSTSYSLTLNGHFIVAGAANANAVTLHATGGNLSLGVSGSTKSTATGVLSASTGYEAALALDYGPLGVPVRARGYLNTLGSSGWSGFTQIVDYFLTASDQASLVPQNTTAQFPIVYDGLTFSSDATTQVSGFNVLPGVGLPDLNPGTAIQPTLTQTGGGTLAIDASLGGLIPVNIADATSFTVGTAANTPPGGVAQETWFEFKNTSGGTINPSTQIAFAVLGYTLAGNTISVTSLTANNKMLFRFVWNGTRNVCSSISTAGYT